MIRPDDDRHNGWIYTICYVLIYLAAPVFYIGVVQASLLDKLGASAAVANLPASTYMLGQIAPVVLAWLVPHRLERQVVVWANLATATFTMLVFLTLVLPVPNEGRIAAVTLQGLLQGLSQSSSFVFMLQCLRRGTTERGLALTLKRTFGLTPLVAVAGSLGAQYLLNPGLPFLPYPYDFAAIHLMAAPCALGIAFAASRFRLEPMAETARPPLREYLAGSVRGFATDRRLLLLWFAYVAWYASLSITSNLSLYTREAMGRDPKDFSGLILAIRFGCKSIGGFFLGLIAVKYGVRAGVVGCILLLAAGAGWGWIAPGAAFLFAFGLLGVGELGGAYLPNYLGRLSATTESARNLAVITLATPASSFAPVLHGALSSHYGFWASFAASIAFAAVALVLVLLTPASRAAAD